MDRAPVCVRPWRRKTLRSREAHTSRLRRDLDPPLHVELAQDVMNVILDGRVLDTERKRDLLVRQALAHQLGDLLLTLGQRAFVEILGWPGCQRADMAQQQAGSSR